MFARTARLLLRPSWPEDAEALYEAVADEVIVRNLARVPWPYSLDDAKAFASRPIQHSKNNAEFLVFRRTHGSPQLIGSCGFIGLENGEIELGYWIARSHWGLGFATEATRSVLEIAKTCGHKRIYAEPFVDNPASKHVLQKLGFRKNGRSVERYSTGRRKKVLATPLVLEFGESEMCKSDEKGDEPTDPRSRPSSPQKLGCGTKATLRSTLQKLAA